MKRENSGNDHDGIPSKFQRPSSDLSNVIIRFLIPARAAGIMIGKGGENIKKIRSQYNLKLNIPDTRGPERIMTVEGDLDSICTVMREVSPKLRDVMNARLSDPKIIMGNTNPRRRGRPQGDDDQAEKEEDDEMLDYRILVHESQAGSVIGRGGDRIKELRDRFRMRVIKVYQMLAPLSTDRVVQMVADPENGISCLKAVIEAIESAPPRGRRENYDAMNFAEMDALNYGGWLSPEGAYYMSQRGPPMRQGAPPMGRGHPDMRPMSRGMGPMHGHMPPMGYGGRPPMPGGRGPMPSGRGAPGSGSRGRGPMMGGNVPSSGGPRSGGPAPVPPPGAQRGSNLSSNSGGYGGPNSYGSQGPMSNYDSTGGYDNSMYGGMEQSGPPSYGGQGYGNSSSSIPSGGGYGGSRSSGDMMSSGLPSRGGSYGGYGVSNPNVHDDAKVSQWYGGWA